MQEPEDDSPGSRAGTRVATSYVGHAENPPRSHAFGGRWVTNELIGGLMLNRGRYVYARRQWLHWWTPLSYQQKAFAATRPRSYRSVTPVEPERAIIDLEALDEERDSD
jgi:hypothetical protein